MKRSTPADVPKNSLAGLLAENKQLEKRSSERAGLAELAALLVQIRQQLNLTQKELAERSGLPKTTISELENTANDGVTLRTIVKIAKGAGGCLSIGLRLDPEAAGRVATSLVTDDYNFRAEIEGQRSDDLSLAA